MHPTKKMFLFATAAIVVTALFAFAPALALAGDVGPNALPALTPETVTIALLGAVVALLAQAYNTGSVFGLKTLPQAWIPWAGLSLTVVGNFTDTIVSYHSVSGTVLFYAAVAGFMSAVGYGGGVQLHKALTWHFNTHKAQAISGSSGETLKAVAFFLMLGAVSYSQVDCTPQAKADVESFFDWADAECEILDAQPQSIIVNVVCDVVDAAGTVVQVLETSTSPATAKKLAADHPVKVGHVAPRLALKQAVGQ